MVTHTQEVVAHGLLQVRLHCNLVACQHVRVAAHVGRVVWPAPAQACADLQTAAAASEGPGRFAPGNLGSRAAYVADGRVLLYARARRAREVGCVVSGHELANSRPTGCHGLGACHPEHRQGSQTEQSRHDADSVHHRTPWCGPALLVTKKLFCLGFD